jgi:hypothetical protein
MKHLITQFSPSSCHILPLRLKYSHRHPLRSMFFSPFGLLSERQFTIFRTADVMRNTKPLRTTLELRQIVPASISWSSCSTLSLWIIIIIIIIIIIVYLTTLFQYLRPYSADVGGKPAASAQFLLKPDLSARAI